MLLLYCEAHGQPTPVVQWYSGATVLNYVAQQFHQSYRVPTDVPHSTVYTCVVTNNADDATHTMRKNIQIIVQSRLFTWYIESCIFNSSCTSYYVNIPYTG